LSSSREAKEGVKTQCSEQGRAKKIEL